MSQNTLKVHDLNEDAEFDENGVEVFDEKALVEEEPSDNDLAEEELLSQGATQRVLDATQLYLGEIGYSPLLTAEEEVYFARRALRGDVASRRRMIELASGGKNCPPLWQSWSGVAGPYRRGQPGADPRGREV